MEKLKKEKHNHKLTDLLKVAIFSMVMLAPIFSVVSKVMYVSFNKNAKDSYYGETINNYTLVELGNNQLNVDNDYLFTTSNFNDTMLNGLSVSQNNRININIKEVYTNSLNVDISGIHTLYFYKTANTSALYLYGNDINNNVVIQTINVSSTNLSFKFRYISGILDENIRLTPLFSIYEYNDYSYMDNVFPYAVNELQNDSLYNWAQDTFAYTSINAMCTGLSVQNGVLPLLLSYWVIITAIYIVFDIIIFTFTKLTHLLQD